jgi:hypothetical protein
VIYRRLYINAKTKNANPTVTKPATSIINVHLKSPLNNAGNIPKNNVVHEKPTGACLIKPLFSKFTVANAILSPYLLVNILFILNTYTKSRR